MAIRTADHPTGIGPPPSSPWKQTWLDTLSVPGTTQTFTVQIPYNAAKGFAGPVITHRDAQCRWTQLVLAPSTGSQLVLPIAAGSGSVLLADIGFTDLDSLETAGYTVM